MAQEACARRGSRFADTTDAFRVVHRGEINNLPFSIDRFGDWLCVTGYDETIPSAKLLKQIQPVLKVINKQYETCGGVVRTHLRDPHHRKLFNDLATFGTPPPNHYWVHEFGLQFEVALNDSQHVGLFLDQRDSRRRIAEASAGKRVANLFSFTCSFSSAAVQGGAEVAFSIDLAAGCLERGKRNFAQSGLAECGRGKFIKEDVRKWLSRQVRKKTSAPATFVPWDLIICDPPVFAAAKKGQSFSVEKEWPELASNIRNILSADGNALFANNHRSGDGVYYRSILEQNFSRVTLLSPPIDFPEIAGTPPHVRIYWCEA